MSLPKWVLEGRKLREAAAPNNWYWPSKLNGEYSVGGSIDGHDGIICTPNSNFDWCHPTARFIAHAPEYQERLEKTLEDAIEIIKSVSAHGPTQYIKVEGVACGFCDMGDSGYATKGNGFHDDNCTVKDAQLFLDNI